MARRHAGISLTKAMRHGLKQDSFRRARIIRTAARIHMGRGARIVIGPRGGVGVIDRRGRPIHIDWKMFERLPETVGPLLRRREELERGGREARDAETVRAEIAEVERELRETRVLEQAASTLKGYWTGVASITGGARKRERSGPAYRRGGGER